MGFSLPFITDWHFYAIAIPAVLLLGLSKSGFGSGFGSLAVPMMALVITVPQAAAAAGPPPRQRTFFIINLAKWIPYAWLGQLDMLNFATSLALLPFAPLGVWVGVRIARRIQPTLFYRLVYLGMFLTGTKLVWDALK